MIKKLAAAALTAALAFSLSSCSMPAKDQQAQKKDLMSAVLENKEILKDIEYTSISFTPLTGDKYIVNLKSADNWANVLWLTEYKDGKIVTTKPITGIAGEVLSIKAVTLSDETCIEAAVASNDGTGSTLIFSDKDLNSPKYTMGGTVDKKTEGKIDPVLAEKYKLPAIGDTIGSGYSLVFQDGYLKTKYSDVNSDGKTDITFYGIREILSADTAAPVLMEYIEYTYMFDKSSGKFVADKSKENIVYTAK